MIRWLAEAGYLDAFTEYRAEGAVVRGLVTEGMIVRLKSDRRFASGAFHGLHPDIGSNRVDFRSYNGALGNGSLQIVISRETWQCYCDIDAHNPYNDVVRFLGHAWDVIRNRFRKWFGKD